MVSCSILLHSRSNPQLLSVRLENGVLMNVSLQLSPSVEAWDLEGQNEYFGGGYHPGNFSGGLYGLALLGLISSIVCALFLHIPNRMASPEVGGAVRQAAE